MRAYRCHFLNHNGYIKSGEVVTAERLGKAIDRALAMLKEQPWYRSVELWRGGKRLYPPSPRAASSRSR